MKGNDKIIKKDDASDKLREAEETEKKGDNKEQDYGKQLKLIFILIGILFGIIVIAYLVYASITQFEYQGTKYVKERIGELTLYHAVFPLYHSITGKHIADFNFYLRNDPRTLEDIPFPEDLELTGNIVLTGELEEIICPENGIAFGNLANAFKNLWQVPVSANVSRHCGDDSETSYLLVKKGNSTLIEKTDKYCYTLQINGCDVLNVTERFIVGAIGEINGY